MNRAWLLLWYQQEKKCQDDCDRDLGIRRQGTGEPSGEAELALLLDATRCGTSVDVGGRNGTEEQEAEQTAEGDPALPSVSLLQLLHDLARRVMERC